MRPNKFVACFFYPHLPLSYQIGFAFIYACGTNTAKSKLKSTLWHGYSGTLYPINPFDSDWPLKKYPTRRITRNK